MWRYILLIVFFLPFGIQAQNQTKAKITVSGQITDSSGNPLPGVNVIVKNQSSLGVISDMDGNYMITKISPYDILVYSYMGFKSQEIPVDKRKVIKVIMTEDTEVLQEVVVVGYGSQKKASVIGAISNIDPVKLRVPTSSVTHALGGRIAGIMSTQRSGEPGADNASFNIRGLSTFGAGSGPLVLVDGVEGRSINDIDIEDIESFSVLKDASATAVYGVRGANGVVMITTRKGKEGKVSISARYEVGLTTPTRLPEFTDSYTYANLKNYSLLGREQSAAFSPMELDKFKYGLDPDLYPNVDWLNELTNNVSMNQKAQVNVSGGSQIARYYISLGYYNEEGFLKDIGGNGYNTNINYNKYNFRSNVDVNITPTTVLELGISGILFDKQRPRAGAGTVLSYAMTMNPTKFPMVYSDGRIPRMNDIENPYEILTQRGYTKEMYNRIDANLTLRQDFSGILKGLTALFKYSFDVENSYNGNYNKKVDTWFATGRDSEEKLLMTPVDQGNTGALSFNKDSEGGVRVNYLEVRLNYDNLFAGVHRIGGLLLYNQRQSVNTAVVNNLKNALPYRSQGLSGRIAYSYKDCYFGEFNFGYNGSENFMKGKRFGFFPSYAVGWLVSNESWFKNATKYVTLLKLRGSYGIVGNDQTGAGRFPFYTMVSGGNGGYTFGVDGNKTFGGAAEGLIGSPNLTWETSKKTNFGFEIGLFDRLTLTGDVFTENRTKIFVRRNSLSSVIGIHPAHLPSANLGEMDNKGFEFTVDYKDRIGNVDIGFFGNFTFNRNKVIETDQAPALYDYQERTGRKLYGTIDMSSTAGMGYVAMGLFKDQEEIDSSPMQTMAAQLRPGDIRYKDMNGDNIINKYDMVFMQSNTPEIIYGFGFSAIWKGIDFSVFFQGLGHCNTFLPEDITPFYYANERGNILQHVADNVFIPADISGNPETENYNALYPRMAQSNDRNNTVRSSYWLRSTAFLRLKNAEIGYTFPQILTKKLFVSKARIYLSGTNLLTFDSFDLWDPEVSGYGTYPLNMVGTIGIKLDF